MYQRNSQKNLQKQQELNQKKADAGLVSERFPKVSGIVLQMTYYQRTVYSDSDSVLMVRTVNVAPENHAYFYMPCMMKECDGGGFDLAPVIRKIVRNRKKRGTGKLVCSGKGPDLPPSHASIHYEITVKYN